MPDRHTTIKQRLLNPIISLILLLAACTSGVESAPVPSAAPAWQDGLAIGQAYQRDAPALFADDSGWTAAWTNGDHLVFRHITATGEPEPAVALPPGRSPWGATLLPAPDHGWHLIWHDLDQYGEPYLYNALLGADGTLQRGPIRISPDPAGTATTAPSDDGTVFIVWASTAPRPALYGAVIDSQGRPGVRAPVLVASNASYPALNRMADGRWVLAWLRQPDSPGTPSNGWEAMAHISSQTFPWQGADNARQIGVITLDSPAVFVARVGLGLDRRYGYLFISEQDATDNAVATFSLPFLLDSPDAAQAQAQRLTFPASLPTLTAPQPTGFNTGSALLPIADELLPASGPAPLYGQYDTTPAAFNVAGWIVIGYFAEGDLASYQLISRQSNAAGVPVLRGTRARDLSVAWMNRPHGGDSPARIILSSTRAGS